MACSASSILHFPEYSTAEFVNPVEEKYRCTSCKNVLQEPMQTSCGHRFCRGCVYAILTDSEPKCPDDGEILQHNNVFRDQVALKEILLLQIYCLQRNEGCQWSGKISELREHEDDCPFQKVECLNKSLGCDEKLLKCQLAKHVKKECRYMETECLYCSEKLPEVFMVKHHEICLKFLVSCSYDCGLKDITREELTEHVKTCPYRPEPCDFSSIGCNFKGPKQLLENHLEASQGEHLLLSKKQAEATNTKVAELQLEVGDLKEKSNAMVPQLESFNEILACTKQTLITQQVKLGQVEKYVASQKETLTEFRHKLESLGRTSNSDEVIRNVRELQDKIFTHEERVINLQQELAKIQESPFGFENRFQSLNLGNTSQDRRLTRMEQSLGLHDVQLAEHDLKIQCLEVASYDGVLIWKIDDYARRFNEAISGKATSLYSPPFYTSRFGYKVCVRLYLNGDGIGERHYMSLFFVIMKGQYDALLPWPFRQKITLKMLGHDRTDDITEAFRPDPNSSSFQRPRSEINLASGCPQFCSHTRLKSGSYIRDDTIFIKVTVDPTGLPTL